MANVKQELPQIFTRSPLGPIKQEVPQIFVSSPRIPTECEDMDGYLRPTFPEQPSHATSIPYQIGHYNATVIPTESYVSSVSLGHRPSGTISPITSTESHPLIL